MPSELVPPPRRAPSIPAFTRTKTRAELVMGEAETQKISQCPSAGRVQQQRNLSQDKRRLGRGGPGAETLPTLLDKAARAPWRHHLLISGFHHHHQALPLPPGSSSAFPRCPPLWSGDAPANNPSRAPCYLGRIRQKFVCTFELFSQALPLTPTQEAGEEPACSN